MIRESTPIQRHLEDGPRTDTKHQLLHERIQGRAAELADPERRAALAVQLSKETHIHPDFIEGFFAALDDRDDTVEFENRKTRPFLPALE